MLNFTLNGAEVSVDAPAKASLLFVLTNDLDMHGLKFGCGKSQCGSCTRRGSATPTGWRGGASG